MWMICKYASECEWAHNKTMCLHGTPHPEGVGCEVSDCERWMDTECIPVTKE